MNQQLEAPHPNGAVRINEKRRPRGTWRWIMLAGIIVASIAWGYAIWYSVSRGSPEDLDGNARDAVGAACTDARDQLEAFPELADNATAAQAVALVRQENEVLATMTDRVETVEPTGRDSGDALDAWARDWRDLIASRAEFATDLEVDGTARLRIPSSSSGSLQPITDRMDEYASGRGLDLCAPQALQAEVVDGPREYPTQES